MYDTHTNLSLEVVDSSKSRRHVQSIIQKLLKKDLDGVICVDMMAEGFDFPNLKIAVIHQPHRSLASTLQFIGRFTRISDEKLGSAKFIAVNNEELLIENINLYREDAVWNNIIVNLSEKRIEEEVSNQQFIEAFELNDNLENEFNLYSINLNYHAKVFRTPYFNIEASIEISGYNLFKSYIYRDINTSVLIFQKHEKPRWTNNDSNIFNSNYECIIAQYDEQHNFIY
ncbi:helicase-related protein [Jeotgalicoccus aerolatus]|uniref:helicase-related protein n=1 Tax=Jeotgalicoccus aerolatus TaxID=709510 RepID=UPI001E39106D